MNELFLELSEQAACELNHTGPVCACYVNQVEYEEIQNYDMTYLFC